MFIAIFSNNSCNTQTFITCKANSKEVIKINSSYGILTNEILKPIIKTEKILLRSDNKFARHIILLSILPGTGAIHPALKWFYNYIMST